MIRKSLIRSVIKKVVLCMGMLQCNFLLIYLDILNILGHKNEPRYSSILCIVIKKDKRKKIKNKN